MRVVAAFGAFVVPLLGLAAGAAFGFGMVELAQLGPVAIVVAAMVGAAVNLLLFAVIQWNGFVRPQGRVAALVVVGSISATIIAATIRLERPLWVGVLLCVVCVALRFFVKIGPPARGRGHADHLGDFVLGRRGIIDLEHEIAAQALAERLAAELVAQQLRARYYPQPRIERPKAP